MTRPPQVTFNEVVAVSRDAQLRQSERERTDRAFIEDIMEEVRTQVQEGGGTLTPQGDWARLNEHATHTYTVQFPENCNVEQIGLTVAGRVLAGKNMFMVGPPGRSADPTQVQDRAQAVSMIMTYLMDTITEIRRLHEL